MQIRAADRKDEEMLSRLDRHIRPEELEVSISLGRVLVAEEEAWPDGCAGICSGTIHLL